MHRGARTWTPGAEISWSEVWLLPCVYGPSGSEMISLGVRRHFLSLHFKENKTIIFDFCFLLVWIFYSGGGNIFNSSLSSYSSFSSSSTESYIIVHADVEVVIMVVNNLPSAGISDVPTQNA